MMLPLEWRMDYPAVAKNRFDSRRCSTSCLGLGDSQSAQVIAKKIIQIGQSGVHDPAQISELAIKQLASISASVPALSNSRPARGWVDQVDQL
jgi:hypothetical protein